LSGTEVYNISKEPLHPMPHQGTLVFALMLLPAKAEMVGGGSEPRGSVSRTADPDKMSGLEHRQAEYRNRTSTLSRAPGQYAPGESRRV